MSTTLRINITREVLEKTKDCGCVALPSNCAISYAIREIWPMAMTAALTIWPFHYSGRLAFARFRHGQSAFIQTFDRATPAERSAMQPFSFDIEVPDEVINEINIDVRRICEGSRTLELVKL